MNFDPNAFLEQTVAESNSTVSVPVPVGEYIAFVDDVKVRQWTSKQDPSKTGVAVDLSWQIDDENVKRLLERDKVTAKQGLMLDVTDEGGLDMGKGKNVSLGRVREAVGLNTPGQPFAFSMLKGKAAKIRIKHRQNPENPEQIFAEVDAVAKIG